MTTIQRREFVGLAASSACITSAANNSPVEVIDRPVCDKCGSADIEFKKAVPPTVRDVKLSEYVNRPQISAAFAVVRYTRMVAECRRCKFSVEYTVPW